MEKIELYGLKITKDIDSKTNLPELIIEEAENQGHGLRENDVIVISSKIVSKAEGRVVKIEDIKPSRKARLLSKFFKKPAEVMELYLREGA
jgi:coenzyme F420-0:L-glutamate ligase/coenzyme F420-1:gamma-L-glutamate ligase